MPRAIRRLFTIKTKFEASVIYALALGACERGIAYPS